MVVLSVVEQRYQAVLEVLKDGRTVVEVAERYGVSRQTVHAWIGRYEAGGLGALADRSHRPRSCPHQMPAEVEAKVVLLRGLHDDWGPRRLRFELEQRGVEPVPSASAIYRCLVRHGLVDGQRRRRRRQDFRRWQRDRPMELWQLDVTGGVVLAGGRYAKLVTGVDDHSRFCVLAKVVANATARPVCAAFAEALRRHGVPEEVLTDNGKVFTGRHGPHAGEVLFERICRENGITPRLTAPRSPTTTGKIERFHKTIKAELLRGRVFADLDETQAAVDVWVEQYNHARPHQALDMATPGQRFTPADPATPAAVAVEPLETPLVIERKVTDTGVIRVAYEQYSVGRHMAHRRVTVAVTSRLLQIYSDGKLVKTLARKNERDITRIRANKPRRQTRSA